MKMPNVDWIQLMKNWKISVPAMSVAFSFALWLFGVPFPRPVLAAEYHKDLKELNDAQIQIREDFINDKLERLNTEKRGVQMDKYELQRTNKKIPDFLNTAESSIEARIKELENELEDIHEEQLKKSE